MQFEQVKTGRNNIAALVPTVPDEALRASSDGLGALGELPAGQVAESQT